MSLFRTVAVAAAATLLATLVGCGGPRLAADPSRGVELEGTWRLDPAASDDARAIVAAALPKPRRASPPPDSAPPLPSSVERSGGASGERSGGHGGAPSTGAPGEGTQTRSPERAAPAGPRDPGGMIRAFVLPATVLRIGGTPHEIVLSQDGRRRAFEPGDDTPYSVTDRYGTRQMRAGWERDEFVIVSRDPRGVELVERFRRGAAPDTLVTTVTLKARGLDDVRISSLYRRSGAEPAPIPAEEGPPAPLR